MEFEAQFSEADGSAVVGYLPFALDAELSGHVAVAGVGGAPGRCGAVEVRSTFGALSSQACHASSCFWRVVASGGRGQLAARAARVTPQYCCAHVRLLTCERCASFRARLRCRGRPAASGGDRRHAAQLALVA